MVLDAKYVNTTAVLEVAPQLRGNFVNTDRVGQIPNGGTIEFYDRTRPGPNVVPTELFMSEAVDSGGTFETALTNKIRAGIRRIVVNVEDFGAVGDGVTDDLDALQAAHDSLPDEGGILWFPGTHVVTATLESGGRSIGLQIWKDHVTLDGPGKIIQTTVGSSQRQVSVIVNGQAKISLTDPLDPATRDINRPVYNLSGSYTLGSKTLTLVTPSQAGNFAAGDDIFIRTGNFGGDPYNDIVNQDPDSEYNIVQSVDAGAGTITLAWPTVKPYAQEYFDDTGYGPTLTTYSTSNQKAVFGVSNITDRVVRDFKCFIPVETLLTGNYSIFLNQVTGVRLRDFHVESFGTGIAGGRCFRDFQFVGITCTRPPGGLQIGGNNFFAPSTACSDGVVANCVLTSDEPRKMHAHEGIADYTVRDNVFRTKSQASNNSQVQNVTIGVGVASWTLNVGGYVTTSLSPTITADNLRMALQTASPDVAGIGNTFRVTGSAGGPYRVNFGNGLAGDNYGPLMVPSASGGTVTVDALGGGQAVISAKSRPYRHKYLDNVFFGAWTDPGADIVSLGRGGSGSIVRGNRIETAPGRYIVRVDDPTEAEVYDNTFPVGSTAGQFYVGPLASFHDNRNCPVDFKRVTPAALSTAAPGATPSVNTDRYVDVAFTAVAANITSMTTNLTGTPTQGQRLTFAITDNGTPRTITWGASFASSTYTSLPGTTVASTTLYVTFRWSATASKWVAVGLS